MRRSDHAAFVVAARWFAPLVTLFALALLANWPAGVGAGFVAGLAFVLPFSLNMLIFGVAAARAATPPQLLRLVFGFGLAIAFASVGLPGLRENAQIGEAGVFLTTGAGLSLAVLGVAGRAAALRDESC